MATKETGFLFVLLLLLFTFLSKQKPYKLFFLSFCSVTVYLIMRLVTIGTQYTKQEFIPIMKLSFLERLVNIPKILFFYLRTFFFPDRLAISQNWVVTKIDFTNFYLPLIFDMFFFLGLGIFGTYLYKQNKKHFYLFLFFLFWFVIGIGMLLQIVPLDMTVADRWMYFPMVGLLGIIGVGSNFLLANYNRRHIFFIIFLVFISCFSIRTIVRNTNWLDVITLYSHDIQVADDYNKEDGLGVELIQMGKYDDALLHIKKSVALNRYYANVNDLGVVYQHKKNIQKAKQYYSEATHMHVYTLAPYLNFATIFVLHDDPRQAISIIKNTLLKNYPAVSRFWVLLAIGEYKLHNQTEALTAAQKAYSLSKDAQTEYVLDSITNKKAIETSNNSLLE